MLEQLRKKWLEDEDLDLWRETLDLRYAVPASFIPKGGIGLTEDPNILPEGAV